ncbi:MAG: hypothetical protein HOC70_05310 [Gammaproteobacteria bacterium]|jgi:hypothetical protein|nr:hypothetical protein [Gammaproteobacteria bacterium]MBT4492643.1 hypothetical protein [Gammaproteobacteria bacterium]MBT7371316.1 hypothetical protein [Gammaproteobacteria bacterium]
MTLPVPPSTEIILRNSIATVRDVLLPAVGDDEWAKFNAGLLEGALQYALESLSEDRAGSHRQHLAEALGGLADRVKTEGDASLQLALEIESPFEAASAVLIWVQNNPGTLADDLQQVLHAELFAQLDEELKAAMPIMGAFQRGMRGDL